MLPAPGNVWWARKPSHVLLVPVEYIEASESSVSSSLQTNSLSSAEDLANLRADALTRVGALRFGVPIRLEAPVDLLAGTGSNSPLLST